MLMTSASALGHFCRQKNADLHRRQHHWWAVPPLPGGVNNGAFSANGAFGQFILVNPTEQVVAAIQSAWRQSHDSDAEVETVALLRAAVRALRPDPAS